LMKRRRPENRFWSGLPRNFLAVCGDQAKVILDSSLKTETLLIL